jgi:Protein of unknown function (DUF3667)
MEYKVSDVKPAVQIHTCHNCKHRFAGKICNQCGEKVFNEEQLTTKHFFHQVIDFFWHWENKVLKTIKLNFLKPGFVTKENLNGVRVPYANPVQLYLVVSLLFYLVVSKVGVSDYIPTYGDHHYFSLSGYTVFKWAEPIDNKVVNAIDSAWTNKGRKMEAELLQEINGAKEPDGSFKLMGRNNKDSFYIPADKLNTYAFRQMMGARWNMFHSSVGTYGKTLIFLLLPVIAGFFFLLFLKKIKYYGAALILATHFMVYNLCFYLLHSLINFAPRYINKELGGWMMKPFFNIFYNDWTGPVSNFIFGSEFEFMHLLFWMPWLLIAFKRLFSIPWWQNLLVSYFLSKVFFFLLYGVLKKIVIAVTIWSMH